MFRFSAIIRELALNLAKVIFMLNHSVELRPYFNINITLARLLSTACGEGGFIAAVSFPFFLKRATTVVHRFVGRWCKNHSKLYAYPRKVLCHF